MIDLSKIKKKGYVIAEIAQSHEGSLGTCFSYAKTAKEIGCDAIKFQIHIADEESCKEEKFRLNIFPQDQICQFLEKNLAIKVILDQIFG